MGKGNEYYEVDPASKRTEIVGSFRKRFKAVIFMDSDNTSYLILEYVDGGELFEYLVQKRRLPEMEAVFIFQQIILGVDFCHKHRVW